MKYATFRYDTADVENGLKFPMCSRCCFIEIIPSLEMKISNNPLSLARSQLTVYAFGRTIFIRISCIKPVSTFSFVNCIQISHIK